MNRSILSAGVASWLLWSATAFAGAAPAEAEKMYEEAVTVLQANSALNTDAKVYAGAVVKLEKAMEMIEKAGAEETKLAVDVNSALFWAKRMSNTNVINEIQHQRTAAGVTPLPPPPPPAEKKDEVPSLVDPRLAEAKKKFDSGMEYAKANESNLYAVALRWFQLADQLAGTDYSVKAMSLARAAQERFAAQQKKAAPAGAAQPAPEEAADTPEMKLIREGDKYLEAGDFGKAIGAYGSSLQMKDTIVANRRLGHAHFDRAQAQKEALLPQFEVVDKEYRAAYRGAIKERRMLSGTRRYVDWNDPALVEAKKKADDLNAKARIALNNYDTAAIRFNAVLKLAPQGKDLDAAGHVALCYSVRRADAAYRARGRQLLAAFVEGYKPANDVERTIYEYCRTELEQLSASKTPQY